MIKITARWAAKGTTGDVTECEFCGKSHLRKTVILVALDDDGNPEGEPVHAGTTCAAHRLSVSTYRVRTDAAAAQRRADQIAQRAAELSPEAVAGLMQDAFRLGCQIGHALNIERNSVQADFLRRKLAPVVELLDARREIDKRAAA